MLFSNVPKVAAPPNAVLPSSTLYAVDRMRPVAKMPNSLGVGADDDNCAFAGATATVDKRRISDVEADRRMWIPEIAKRRMIFRKNAQPSGWAKWHGEL